ncbi:neuropeptide FF receptor 1 [Lampetra fluviatilis]
MDPAPLEPPNRTEGDRQLPPSFIATNATFYTFYQHAPPTAAVYLIAYLFIFLLCMIGNGLVCYVVLQSRRMRTVTNLFILNLAVSDLLVGIFCMPITLVDNLITGWPFGVVVCKMSGLVQGTSVSASVFTLVAIAVDRFRCIVYPFKRKLRISHALFTILVIWALALAIMCPSALMLTAEVSRGHYMVYSDGSNDTHPLQQCWEAWPDPRMRKAYTTVLFANVYLAPLALILLMYARIGFRLCSLSASAAAAASTAAAAPSRGGGGGGDDHDDHDGGGHGDKAAERANGRQATGVTRRRVKVIKMLIIVAMLFMLSWLPLWTVMMLVDYANLSPWDLAFLNMYVYPVAHWLAFFNSSVNPIVYGYFNENFRRGFQAAFKLQLCAARPDPRDTCPQQRVARAQAAHAQQQQQRNAGPLHAFVGPTGLLPAPGLVVSASDAPAPAAPARRVPAPARPAPHTSASSSSPEPTGSTLLNILD